MELEPGVRGCETPLHGILSRVAGFCPGLHLPAHALHIRQTPIQALARQNGELDLCRVQPTAVLGCVSDNNRMVLLARLLQ